MSIVVIERRGIDTLDSPSATCCLRLAEKNEAVVRLEKINEQLASHAETATLQRIGYIADKILNQQPLADAVEDIYQKLNFKFFRVSLMAKGKRYGFPCDDRWKVIENSVIEID